jgi:head-tail adaptor
MGEGREFTATHVKLFTPHGADVSATSRVRIESNIYDVDGEPGVWNDATGRGMYVVILLKMLAG